MIDQTRGTFPALEGGLTLPLVGQHYFTFVDKALSSMTTGYVDEDEARLEHAKWVDELEREAEATPLGKEEEPAATS